MRADRRSIAIALLLAFVFGMVSRWMGGHGHSPLGAVRSLSAPWLVLPFVAGALQSSPRRGAVLGLVCTYVALAGYGLMTALAGPATQVTPMAPAGYLSHERYTFAASLVTGPLFGWFGWNWRSRRAIAGALVTAAAFCLEPMARQVVEKPIRFSEVAAAEVATGLALAAVVLIRRTRPA
ncbi:MAG: hypothetical protein QOG85_805 [Gaiellaceae bacterium]|jgi:hypothetical protein|nr:hypothetical protein [Gaiellaceae bacterium]